MARAGGRERREIAKIPRSFVSRAEVVGLVAQVAAGERLDFSRFVFDYRATRTIEALCRRSPTASSAAYAARAETAAPRPQASH